MKKEKSPKYEGFRPMDRSETVSVEGGGSGKFIEVIRAVARAMNALSQLSSCVDDFIEGYQEGFESAMAN